MKILEILKSNIKSFYRNWKNNAIIFILPVVFMGVFGTAFGESFIEKLNYSIGIVGTNDTKTDAIAKVLGEIKTKEDADSFLYYVKKYSSVSSGKDAVLSNEIVLLISLEEEKFVLYLSGKEKDINMISAPLINILDTIYGDTTSYGSSVILGLDDKQDLEDIVPFQFLAPGLIVYGLLMILIQVAIDFTKIAERADLFRFRVSSVMPYQILTAYIIFYILIGIVQSILLVISARLFGMVVYGSYLDVAILLIPAILLVIGSGIVLGSIFSKSDVVSNVGTIITVVLGFLSGAFIWQSRI